MISPSRNIGIGWSHCGVLNLHRGYSLYSWLSYNGKIGSVWNGLKSNVQAIKISIISTILSSQFPWYYSISPVTITLYIVQGSRSSRNREVWMSTFFSGSFGHYILKRHYKNKILKLPTRSILACGLQVMWQGVSGRGGGGMGVGEGWVGKGLDGL